MGVVLRLIFVKDAKNVVRRLTVVATLLTLYFFVQVYS